MTILERYTGRHDALGTYGMTFPEAVEELLAVSIATYLNGQRRERLREAIELSVRTLNEWDQARLGISQEQLAALTAWAKTAPGREGVQ